MGVAMISGFKKILSKLNRARKNQFSSRYVSKEKFNQITEKYESLINGIVSIENSLSLKPSVRCLQPIEIESGVKDICLFVSYAANPTIKEHVAHHIKALVAQGIAVVLILNTDVDIYEVERLFMPELSGLYVRENRGFDFGAWSHIYTLIKVDASVERLYLVNDSLIGPLTDRMFGSLIEKVRVSKADFIGLTANAEPFFHIQSFFLVIGKKLLNDQRFKNFFGNLWNLPTKDMVIDFYEKRFANLVMNLGFETEVLFDTRHLVKNKSDPVIHSMDELLKMDFPYVKTSMAFKPAGENILKKFPLCGFKA